MARSEGARRPLARGTGARRPIARGEGARCPTARGEALGVPRRAAKWWSAACNDHLLCRRVCTNNLPGVSSLTRPRGGGIARRAAADEAARGPWGNIDAADRSVQMADGNAAVDQTARGGGRIVWRIDTITVNIVRRIGSLFGLNFGPVYVEYEKG